MILRYVMRKFLYLLSSHKTKHKKSFSEKLFTTCFLNDLKKSKTLFSNYWTRLNNIDILDNSMLSDPRFKNKHLKLNVDKEEFLTIFEEKGKRLKKNILKQLENDAILETVLKEHKISETTSNILLRETNRNEVSSPETKSDQMLDLEIYLEHELAIWFSRH